MKTGLLILACVMLSGCASFHTDMVNEEGKMVSCRNPSMMVGRSPARGSEGQD